MTLPKEVYSIYMGIIVPSCIIIPIIPAVIKYKQLPTELKVVCLYLLIGGITSVLASMIGLRGNNNMPIMHAYTLIEFLVWATFYKHLFADTPLSKYMHWVMLAFVLTCVANAFFLQSIFTYNTYTKSIEALVIIIFAIAYFMKVLDKIVQGNIKNTPVILINSGLLLYFSGSFIMFVISNMVVTQRPTFFLIMWSLHATFLLFLYLLIAAALWKYKK